MADSNEAAEGEEDEEEDEDGDGTTAWELARSPRLRVERRDMMVVVVVMMCERARQQTTTTRYRAGTVIFTTMMMMMFISGASRPQHQRVVVMIRDAETQTQQLTIESIANILQREPASGRGGEPHS